MVSWLVSETSRDGTKPSTHYLFFQNSDGKLPFRDITEGIDTFPRLDNNSNELHSVDRLESRINSQAILKIDTI